MTYKGFDIEQATVHLKSGIDMSATEIRKDGTHMEYADGIQLAKRVIDENLRTGKWKCETAPAAGEPEQISMDFMML